MLYCPSIAHRRRLKLLEWPLPPKLLPWLLNERGLGIVVLPEDWEAAQRTLHGYFNIKDPGFSNDSRLAAATAHYRHDRRLLVMTHDALYDNGYNIFLHEIGHALDFLYRDTGPLSFMQEVWTALRPNKPLNDYCARKQKQENNLLEQFATAFQAYFTEPEGVPGTNTIDDLGPEIINIFRHKIIGPFT